MNVNIIIINIIIIKIKYSHWGKEKPKKRMAKPTSIPEFSIGLMRLLVNG